MDGWEPFWRKWADEYDQITGGTTAQDLIASHDDEIAALQDAIDAMAEDRHGE
jgi:hypothetical protein